MRRDQHLAESSNSNVVKRFLALCLLNSLASGLLMATVGCGSASDLPKQEASLPAPHPGSSPESRPPIVLEFCNQSPDVTPEQWADAVSKINQQIQHDLNPRWGCNGAAVVVASADFSHPGVALQNRDSGPGGYTDGLRGWCAYRANTADTWRAYCSHVAINLLTPGYLAGQSVEPWDYRASDYVEAPPWELADFDFPSAHGLGGEYLDYAGQPAHDLLHKLAYP